LTRPPGERGDTNTPNLLERITFPVDHLRGLEEPESYSLGDAIDLDRDSFQAFAKEFKLVEQNRGATSTMLVRNRQQLEEFGQFHTAFRYAQEINRLENKLKTEKDPKKREKLEKDIQKRRDSKEYKKFGKRVEKYVRKHKEKEQE
jgi:hypothetical protein